MIVILRIYLGDVDLLDLQVVQDVRQRLKRDELSGADILLTLGII